MLLFLVCTVFGAVLLIAQLVAGAADGGDAGHAAHVGDAHADGVAAAVQPHGAPHAAEHAARAPLGLLGLRPLAAGIAFFGVAGAAVRAQGGGGAAALAAAALAGVAAVIGTAALLRVLLRFESDGAVRLDAALGAEATVYVAIPARGSGKVQLVLQGRLVESSATAVDGAAYATGARVLVVDRASDGGLLVAADPAAPDPRGPFVSHRSALP